MVDAQEAQAAPSRARLIPAADLLAAAAPQRRPDWIKVRAPAGPEFERLRSLMRTRGLHTVCEEALCPQVRLSPLMNQRLSLVVKIAYVLLIK